ncbi:putative phosphotransferase enzyme family protein [Phaeomoniella chlamydospora]|uniref:Putative phosphotransferase enzyme family protein n=1 Tax=Phaeomoniella chlamydospora TaxID=158046 RepID=A0A0G2ELD3_PHACM|nr:putative phosphotransferase enzyme family protein [Phaeomoniella chlamydospora]
MTALVTDTEIRSATWIVGHYGARYGVCVTGSNIVKFAPAIQTSREIIAIKFVRQKCPNIPVPEVRGAWEVDEDDGEKTGYFAMSVLPGSILRDLWHTMTDGEKKTVLDDFAEILGQLRCVQAPEGSMIGAVDGIGPAADLRAGGTELGGPFTSECDFNEWLVSLIHPESRQYFSDFFVETIRSSLAGLSAHRIRFSHGDLGMHNILVEGGRITGIIDWEYAGWYPEYWEYVKMIQFSRDKQFLCWCQQCWDIGGSKVRYDREFVVDNMLDSQVRHGARVIKRPR